MGAVIDEAAAMQFEKVVGEPWRPLPLGTSRSLDADGPSGRQFPARGDWRCGVRRFHDATLAQPGETVDMKKTTELSCACGQVRLEVEGAPIVNAECCCNSCRAAGASLQNLPSAPPVLDANGATRFVLYRKDRIGFMKGAALLKQLRLTPESKTRRVVASCCNTPVFLEFQNGHWLSLYGCLWPKGTLPALEMRTMTIDLPDGTALPDDVPNAKRQSFSFMLKLLSAWVAMGFRVPKITVSGEFHA